MGFLDDIEDRLTPHLQGTTEQLRSHAALIYNKLDLIHQATSDLGRPDFGDFYFSIVQRAKFPVGKTDIGAVPTNEIWLVQAVTVNGIVNKTPTFLIESNGIMRMAVIKEGIGTESLGGNIALLPGEVITINNQGAEEGTIHLTMTVIRKQLPKRPIPAASVGAEPLIGKNTHEIERDVIASPTDIWVEPPGEIVPETIDDVIPGKQ